MAQQARTTTRPDRKAASPLRAVRVPSQRTGKQLLGGHFAPETKRLFRILAAEQTKTGQELLEEAVADLLKKYHKL